jgi:hypothetical protein
LNIILFAVGFGLAFLACFLTVALSVILPPLCRKRGEQEQITETNEDTDVPLDDMIINE